MSELVEAAARNNAAWCDALCRTHGVAGDLRRGYWASAIRTPPRYPDAITLEPNVASDALLTHIDHTSPGGSVKDSFADLELTPRGFQVLFDAEWIAREPAVPGPGLPDGAGFSVISTSGALEAWERGWDGDATATRTFRPSLLALDQIRVFGRLAGDDVTAGFVANRAHGAVGISNVFDRVGRPAWASCISAIGRVWPGLPTVGYETGPDLDAALSQGFVALGPLRVWVSEPGPGGPVACDG